MLYIEKGHFFGQKDKNSDTTNIMLYLNIEDKIIENIDIFFVLLTLGIK